MDYANIFILLLLLESVCRQKLFNDDFNVIDAYVIRIYRHNVNVQGVDEHFVFRNLSTSTTTINQQKNDMKLSSSQTFDE